MATRLLNFLRSLRKIDREVRLLLLGLDNAGKTTILKRLSNEDVKHVRTTQGFNVKSIHHDNYKINVWDIGGQQQIRQYWKNYFDGVNAMVYVIDSADETRLAESGDELSKLLQEEKLSGIPVLIFANKMDLANAMPPKQIAELLQLHLIREHAWEIKNCSAKDGTGLEDGLRWLVDKL
eukprot:TRINITY_DN924_c0_g1_i3.p1 TRINITY_DN924_c0_g1~~TRINITY_DN924_c0_g1_i3.p1  ORF type:complete len:187 (-),score=60.84 TRINITY_DN924_c0_g1_i3:75-611(-)